MSCVARRAQARSSPPVDVCTGRSSRLWKSATSRSSCPCAPEAMAAHPTVQELIEREVAAANRHLASYESIKYFRILPRDLSTETGELTASLKVKRKVMAERYAVQIEEMYRASKPSP